MGSVFARRVNLTCTRENGHIHKVIPFQARARQTPGEVNRAGFDFTYMLGSGGGWQNVRALMLFGVLSKYRAGQADDQSNS